MFNYLNLLEEFSDYFVGFIGNLFPKVSYNSILGEGEVKGNNDDWFTICQTIYFALDA